MNRIFARHRLERIETVNVSCRYPRQVGVNARLGIHGTGRESDWCQLTTDQGAQGWGLGTLSSEDRGVLLGRPLDELFDPDQGTRLPAAMPLDFALHDLAARILGMPVHRMLGAQGPPAIPCYDGAIYMDDLLPFERPAGIDVVLANCAADYAQGYRAFKLKIGRGHKWMSPKQGLQRDIEITRRVRETYPDCHILVDANDGYDGDGFLAYLERVADCNLYWIEEPFEENTRDLTRLREYLTEHSPDTLVADGERDPDIPQLLAWAKEGLIDVLLMDIVGLGFTAWRCWMPEVIAAGALASPHAWGVPFKTLYAAQLAGGLGHVPTIEGVPGISHELSWSGYRLEAGMLHLPDGPGFGIEWRIP
jgi:L-alanine-DL-glutamate epimerase-like enolase superfamily enzyme